MKKRLCAMLLSVLMLTSSFSVTVNANQTEVSSGAATAAVSGETFGEYEYSLNDDGETVTIMKYTGSAAEVVIQKKIGGKAVTSIGFRAFYGCESIESVTIPDSVTSIGVSAFFDCQSLASVTIPDSVTSIGEGAFYYCQSLASVTIPDSVTSIGGHAFDGCQSLTSVTIPDSVTSIGLLAFSGTPWLSNYPDDFVIVGNNILIGYKGSDTSVTIPNSVTSIGGAAFYGCTSLTNVTIPDSVTNIGDAAFSGCNSVTIYGNSGSYAETYANENNIPFKLQGELPASDSDTATDTDSDTESDTSSDVTPHVKPHTYYFLAPESWFKKDKGALNEDIGFYAWTAGENSTENAKYPGVKMTLAPEIGENVFKIEMDEPRFEQGVFSDYVDFDPSAPTEQTYASTVVFFDGYMAGDCSYDSTLTCDSFDGWIYVLDLYTPTTLAEYTGLVTCPGEWFTLDDYKNHKDYYGTYPEYKETSDTPEPIGTYGDIDGDEEISSADALMILRIGVGLEEITPEQFAIADVDGDDDITSADALAVLRFSAGFTDDSVIGQLIR